MKRNLFNIRNLIIILVIILPFSGKSQDKQEKTVTVKTISNIDGKTTEIDTTYTITGEFLVDEMPGKYLLNIETDSVNEITVKIDIDSVGKNKKIFIVGDNAEPINYHLILDEASNMLFFNNGDKKLKVMDEISINLDNEKLENLNLELEKLQDVLDDLEIEFDDKKTIMIKEIKELDRFKELQDHKKLESLKELENLKIYLPDFDNNNVDYFYNNTNRVSEEELRNAGIKSKPDRLVVDNLNIDINDGVIKIDFNTFDKINPKVLIYNYFGDIVYSGKPEYNNGTYSLVIDLSKKQKGTYYLQLVSKNTSLSRKLKI